MGKEQRRSRRYLCRIVTDLHGRKGVRSLATSNVSRHGIFVATPDPPPERHVVQLTLHTPLGKLKATAWVSRCVREHPEPARRGAGLQFFSMSNEAKQRWDEFFYQLGHDAASAFEAHDQGVESSFVVKLKSVEKLAEFEQTCVARGAAFLVTPVLKPPGTAVAMHMVHPDTEEEFVLRGRIARLHTKRPKGIELQFTDLSRKLRQSFRTFVRTGAAVDDEVSVRRAEPTGEIPLPVLISDTGVGEEERFDIDVIDEQTVAESDIFDWQEVDDELTLDLDIDDEILIDFDELSVTDAIPIVLARDSHEGDNPWAEPPTTAEELVKRLGGSTRLEVVCPACGLSAEVTLGPAPGLLGLVADDVPLWDPQRQELVCAPRLGPVQERQARLEELAGPDGDLGRLFLPLPVLFQVVALKEAPTAEDGTRLVSTQATRDLEKVAARLLKEGGAAPDALQASCSRCDGGPWTVKVLPEVGQKPKK